MVGVQREKKMMGKFMWRRKAACFGVLLETSFTCAPPPLHSYSEKIFGPRRKKLGGGWEGGRPGTALILHRYTALHSIAGVTDF